MNPSNKLSCQRIKDEGVFVCFIENKERESDDCRFLSGFMHAAYILLINN